jgi:hypothetical protein
MPQPIYKCYMLRWKESWYQLSQEDRDQLLEQVNDSFQKVGGKNVIFCNSAWSSEAWLGFGVEEFPDIEAAQQHASDLLKFNWFQYVEATSVLGTKT